MAQCEKCGRSDRVVSKSKGYWMHAIGWTFGILLVASENASSSKDQAVGWFIVVGVALVALYYWKKAISGAGYIQHECKICDNKWKEKL